MVALGGCRVGDAPGPPQTDGDRPTQRDTNHRVTDEVIDADTFHYGGELPGMVDQELADLI
ncbi:hypothetical protein OG613_01235 [Streptomyces sp. NBC_00015]|uniref:hypothetical protein n=1 Tax=Streptomyces sp. NBC_00015 TaxID=2903611 RepID=UPI00324B77C7